MPSDFEHIFTDGHLCLGDYVEQMLWLSEHPSLLGFINQFLVNYFFAAEYFRRYGVCPSGQRSHGSFGILEYYQDYFVANDLDTVLRLMHVVRDKTYRGHLKCPCESGLITRNCHGASLMKLLNLDNPAYFDYDMEQVDAFVDAFITKKRKEIEVTRIVEQSFQN